MKFKLTHTFNAPLEEVERILLNPRFLEILQDRMTTIKSIQPIEIKREGNILKRKIRYKPEPLIKKIGVKKVEPEWMEWIEESTYNFDTHTGNFNNIPVKQKIAAVMKNYGTFRLIPLSDSTTQQVLEGELTVSVFMVGKAAERVILQNAKLILDEEAKVLQEVLKNKEL